MSTSYFCDPPLTYEQIVSNTPPRLVAEPDVNGHGVWLRHAVGHPAGTRDALSILQDPSGIALFTRYNSHRVGLLLQRLADHFGVTFTCELYIERVVPGGNGKPPEGFYGVDP